MSQLVLTATERATGKGAARRLRAGGGVPAVLYGHGMEPMALALERKAVDQLLSQPHGLVVQISYPGGKGRVLLREVLRKPVSGDIEHIDLQLVRAGDRVEARVPVVASGEEDLIRRGLTLSWLLDHLMIEAAPDSLPDHLTIDVQPVQEESTLHASAVTLPRQVRLVTAAEEPIVAIQYRGAVEPSGNDA